MIGTIAHGTVVLGEEPGHHVLDSCIYVKQTTNKTQDFRECSLMSQLQLMCGWAFVQDCAGETPAQGMSGTTPHPQSEQLQDSAAAPTRAWGVRREILNDDSGSTRGREVDWI